ncbi:MAG: M48 family metalloprotease [Candidatus Aminicenantes bacterium]|nr:M48 family metalloprotease [Candidatus Aminicenantes bacterium]
MPRASLSVGVCALIALITLMAAACAVNPVTGKKELMLYSEADEIAMGKQTDQQVKSIYGIYADKGLNSYVNKIGQELVPYTHRPHLTYHFAILDSHVVNAFAVPGGYVYVTRGIMAMMNSEAELAVVLGHELGHVNARHSMSRLSNQAMVGLGLAAGSAISKTFSDLAGLASTGMQLLFLKYSRDDEREADQLGVDYSRQGGYNPSKMIDFFASLENLGDLSGGQTLPGFLSTHPLTSERIQNTQDMIRESDNQLKVNQNGYFDRINNMIYGPDPRQGYIEGHSFYHPDLRFSFSFPADWKVQNNPSQVLMVSKDENAAVILQTEKSSENPREYSQKQLSQVEGIKFIEDRSLRINGLSAYQHLLDYSQPDQSDLRILLTYIQYNSFIYTFTSLSTVNQYSAYSRRFQNLAKSFQRLSDPKSLNRQPKRLKFMKADGRQSLKTMFQSARMPEDLWPKMAIMNGLKLEQAPPRGQLIKTIQ